MSDSWFHVVDRRYGDPSLRASLGDAFASEGYVHLPGLIEPRVLAQLRSCVERARREAVERAFVMPVVGTPRRLATIGGRTIADAHPALSALYCHHEIVSLLRDVVRSELYRCQHADEYMVVNYLTRQNDCHGWHLDDPPYALIVVIDAPPPEVGGLMEYVRDWKEVVRRYGAPLHRDVEPTVERARAEGFVTSRYHAPGDGYVLAASKALHRVTDFRAEGFCRTVLNMAYQREPRQLYGHTATALYGLEHREAAKQA